MLMPRRAKPSPLKLLAETDGFRPFEEWISQLTPNFRLRGGAEIWVLPQFIFGQWVFLERATGYYRSRGPDCGNEENSLNRRENGRFF